MAARGGRRGRRLWGRAGPGRSLAGPPAAAAAPPTCQGGLESGIHALLRAAGRGERWAARGCGDRRQRRGRCRIPLGLSRPVLPSCLHSARAQEQRSPQCSTGRGDKWSRQRRDAQLPLLEIPSRHLAGWIQDWRHTLRTASYPTHRRPPLHHAHPPMHLDAIQPRAAAALNQSHGAMRLDGIDSLERCQERRSPPRRR